MAVRDRSPAQHEAKPDGAKPDRAKPVEAKPAARAAGQAVPTTDLAAGSAAAEGDDARPVLIEGVEARLAARMSESLTMPTATSFREIDVTTLVAQRARLNEALSLRKLSYTHLLAYAVAQAAAIHPRMAAFYREIDGRAHRIERARIGLGIAVDVEQRDGNRLLLVPVIRGADDLEFSDLVAAFDDIVERARTGRLSPDDMAGGTITLTNPGALGTTASVPRLMPGQGTIVATGAIRRSGATRLMTISSTYDHRIIQGAQSGLFLATIDELLQGADGFYDSIAAGLGLPARGPAATERGPAPGPLDEPATMPADVAAAAALVRSYRTAGHLAAHLDPLGEEPTRDPVLDPATWGLTDATMAGIHTDLLRVDVPGETLAEAIPALQRTYCGTIAFEVEHIGSHEERTWLRRAIESGEHRTASSGDQRQRVLLRLTEVEAFEQFLGRAFLGQKRFSIEGLDVLVPMLDQLVELAASSGTRTVEIGMTHRGRLSVLAHVVGVGYAEILGEFERSRPGADEEVAPEGETNDVKYHRGAVGQYEAKAGPVRIVVASNPSHLEAIDPVIEGRARAAQTDRSRPEPARDPTAAIAVLIHGDASFAAQGVVAETFNLARLAGYTTGGTVHLIANNQLGFTVEPRDGRSTDYASDLAKGFDVPIVHVNADDPDACLSAVRLAHAYRERFHGDVVIDVVGYRRHGHNEGDEPAYTQPVMYGRIADHPTVRQVYVRRLAEAGEIDERQADEELARAERHLTGIQTSVEADLEEVSAPPAAPVRAGRPPRTTVDAARLRAINEGLLSVPPGFTIHPKLAPQIDRRRSALGRRGRIDWAHAEALALGSLLLDGTPVRLTGQDTERGTFSQRHLMLHDAANGQRYAPIQHLAGARAPFELHDSPLSEFACLGFEYGYAVEAPEALVLWEAQYGDFANEAEVIIDQFIIAGLAKWGDTSRLTLLLPHGYEGQGPEHSSARLERYLALGADDNIRVANCTTPAQYFHLLRDQAVRELARPLVLMTPKGLLRLPAASSSLGDLTRGRFRPVLDDPGQSLETSQVRRLVLCSGRLYYDLALSPQRSAAERVAIARLELLYPFPAADLRSLVKRYPNLETLVWAQEEPHNMGARKFVLPELQDLVPPGLPIIEVSRPERSSPAEGSHAAHRAEQARIVEDALAN